MTDANMDWSLYCVTPVKGFPSKTYFWVDEFGIVRGQRNVTPIGFVPVELENMEGEELRDRFSGMKKKVKHRMTQEELRKGWLIL